MIYTDQDKAIAIIKGYLNVADNPKWTNEYILNNYGIVVDMLIEKANAVNSLKKPGVTSMKEGKQAITFDSVLPWELTKDLKILLPVPFVKGW